MDTLPFEIESLALSYLNSETLIELFKSDEKYYTNLFNKYGKSIDITLDGSNISDNDLKYVKYFHSVKLSYCSSITNNGLKYLQNVHNICLWCCNNITNDGLKILTNAKHIDLIGCDKIKEKELVDIISCSYTFLE